MPDLPGPSRALLITGARVFTADRSSLWADAVVARGGDIDYVGGEGEARAQAGHGAVDLHVPGGLVLPGLNDSHMHLSYGAHALTILNLEGVTTAAELQSRVRKYAGTHPDRGWIEGDGLAYEPFVGLQGVERETIDEAEATRPVLLRAFDYHSAWANTEGLRRAGIERGAAIRKPAEVVVDARSGLATGMLKENEAVERVSSLVPEATSREKDEALHRAMRHLNRLGITSVQNMHGDREQLERYARLREGGKLSVRASHYLRPGDDVSQEHLAELLRLAQVYTESWNRVAGLKFFIDGVVEAKTAWMTEPYADGSGDVGEPVYDPEVYRDAVVRADALGLDIATHAIGDRGVHCALDAYAAAAAANPTRHDRRHRVEHVEVALPSDIPRFGSEGVIASMQPLHAAPTTDPRSTPWTRLVGPEREPYAFAWQSLLETGAVLAFGSDWPIVTADVRRGIRAALTRRNAAGEPAGGWQPQQCLTLAQALLAYTASAAFAERQEHRKGRLRPGMAADITIFAQDLFRLHPEELTDVEIAATVVDGRIVYRAV